MIIQNNNNKKTAKTKPNEHTRYNTSLNKMSIRYLSNFLITWK